MRDRVDLYRRAEEHARAPMHTGATSKTTQLEIEKDAVAERNIGPLVTVEGRLDPDAFARVGAREG
jgi:hypothetical protein